MLVYNLFIFAVVTYQNADAQNTHKGDSPESSWGAVKFGISGQERIPGSVTRKGKWILA